MRLFIALELPNEIAAYLLQIQKKIGNTNAKINWVAKKNLHLTLKFLGEIPDRDVEHIQHALRTITAPPLTVTLSHLGVFPNTRIPHVLWIGLTPDRPIIVLQKMIDQETIAHGKQDHTFQAHLTLGRIKTLKHNDAFNTQIKELTIEKKQITFTTFHLIKSTLTRTGPRYEILEHYPLVT